MAKITISAEFDKKDLKALDKDIDKLFTDIGRELASAPKMRPMVDKIKQGMRENSFRFTNSEIWEDNKELAKDFGLIDFDSPLMMTGQMVEDFIYYAGKPKVSQIPNSNEFELGRFTWAAKERRRPSYRHILNKLAVEQGKPEPYPDADKFTYIKTNDLVRLVMKSPRYPIMDSMMSLYSLDIFLFTERLIDEVFSKRR